ncbi:MAG: DEAD/DEAH box helicase, partial [Lautropia mirabilis]|nr:DEAD/DEAH box helicase [Lautropia mirabilis]
MQPLILADQLTRGVADFLRAAFPSSTPGFDGLLERFLARPGNLFKGPYLTLPLPFRTQADPGKPFFSWLPDGFRPYAHQARAFKRLSGDHAASTLVATGTGSGKTECFLYPILEHCRQQRQAGRKGIKAIILYPMNALATDQASRLARLILSNAHLSGIRAGLYVGGDAKADPADGSTASDKVQQLKNGAYSLITDRAVLRKDPPDILLTNYKMLDFLLIRAEDSPLWAHQQPDTQRYLVVDELHTFDGAQGTDLACLIRRLKGRLRTPPGQLVCVGTSATLGSEGEEGLLAFAGQIFGERFQAAGNSSGSSTEGNDAIITEDRLPVAEYLQNLVVEYTQTPQQEDEAILDPSSDAAGSPKEWLAAQVPLWFGETHRCKTPNEVEDPLWRCKLADMLRGHFAFQNLLKDLERLTSRSVPVEQVLQTLTSRLPAGSSSRFASLWLGSLLALVAHARTARGGTPARQVAGPESASQSVAGTGKAIETTFFLQVKVEIWLRELRRMVASLD